MSTQLLLIVGIIVVFVVWIITIFNSLIRSRNRVKEAFSDMDVQLKRRYDLIPNLVSIVKGYAKHEDSVFEKVTTARAQALGAQGLDKRAEAENALSGTLKSLFAVSENYPELKANENFLSLQSELADTENKIQASRRFYNGVVLEYNTKIQVFPTMIFASMLSFSAEPFFEIANAQERDAVTVSF